MSVGDRWRPWFRETQDSLNDVLITRAIHVAAGYQGKSFFEPSYKRFRLQGQECCRFPDIQSVLHHTQDFQLLRVLLPMASFPQRLHTLLFCQYKVVYDRQALQELAVLLLEWEMTDPRRKW
jgi:hypothetical protein